MESEIRLDRAPDATLRREKKPYEKPELVVHGSVGRVTQTGGTNQHPDGVFTHKLS